MPPVFLIPAYLVYCEFIICFSVLEKVLEKYIYFTSWDWQEKTYSCKCSKQQQSKAVTTYFEKSSLLSIEDVVKLFHASTQVYTFFKYWQHKSSVRICA